MNLGDRIHLLAPEPGSAWRDVARAMPRQLSFGPGIPIPIVGESYAQTVLNEVGREVAALAWSWPLPYDGEQRRAAVRIRRKASAIEAQVRAVGSHFATFRVSGVTA